MSYDHLGAALCPVPAPVALAPEVPAHAAEKVRLDTTQCIARSVFSLERLPPLPGGVHGRHVVAQQLLPAGDGRGGAAYVAEVLARSDLGVGRAMVRHERRPRVQPKLGRTN